MDYILLRLIQHLQKLPDYMKNCLNYTYATRPLLQCFLQSNLDKNTAEAHKEPSTIYKSDLRTLKGKHLVLSSHRLLGVVVKFRTCPKPHELSRVPLFHRGLTSCQDVLFDLNRSFLRQTDLRVILQYFSSKFHFTLS